MKIFIAGFANSGKTTIFNALTGLNLDTTIYPTPLTKETTPHHGVVNVPDERLERLSSVFKPKKTTPATLQFIDYIGIIPNDPERNRMVYDLIKDSEAIVHVVRAFEDESVMHPSGSVDALRDVRNFETELIIGDMEFVEKRLERIEEQAKKGKRPDEADRTHLLKCREALEGEVSLRDVQFTDAERRLMLPYQFLTTMPEIIVLNIGEDQIGSDVIQRLQDDVINYFKGKGNGIIPPVIPVCGKMEMEIAQLPEDERRGFLEEMGIGEPAMERLCKITYETLGLISFLTVGKDEVRAWTIKGGTNAQSAAGRIHSDMERGFIKAEVVSYDDFISSGKDMHRVKERGLLRLEGKDYIVKDGDIITFKFNV
ncbi:MAG: redox-regulated ATPase YchF [Thermodesulfovibrionia bacterium]